MTRKFPFFLESGLPHPSSPDLSPELGVGGDPRFTLPTPPTEPLEWVTGRLWT